MHRLGVSISLIMLQKTASRMNTVVKTNNMYETGLLIGRVPYLTFPMKYHPKMIFHDMYIILSVLERNEQRLTFVIL